MSRTLCYILLVSLSLSCQSRKANEALDFFKQHQTEFNDVKTWCFSNQIAPRTYPMEIDSNLKQLKICAVSTDDYYKCSNKKSLLLQFDGCRENGEDNYIYFIYYDCPERGLSNSWRVKDVDLGNNWIMREMTYDYLWD